MKKHYHHYLHGASSSQYHIHSAFLGTLHLHKTKKADYYCFVLRRERLITSSIYRKDMYTRLLKDRAKNKQPQEQISLV